MSALSYMPLQTHEVHNSVPPPSASENPASYDEHAGNLSTTPSIRSENPDWDLGNSTRKAPRAPRGTVQLMKSLLLPLVGEGVHSERPPTSDAVLQPSRIFPFATLCIVGWLQSLQTSSLAKR